jgi:hypothetical protein
LKEITVKQELPVAHLFVILENDLILKRSDLKSNDKEKIVRYAYGKVANVDYFNPFRFVSSGACLSGSPLERQRFRRAGGSQSQ